METYPISSISVSISGEVGPVFPQGSRCIILRFSGCNLACDYCDTPDTQKVRDCSLRTSDEIIEFLADLYNVTGCANVLVTGGEPLLYEQCLIDIIEGLPLLNFQIETNGTIYPKMQKSFLAKDMTVARRVGFVVDIKSFMLNDLFYITSIEEWFDYAVRYSNKAYFKIPFGLHESDNFSASASHLSHILMLVKSLAIGAKEKHSRLEVGIIKAFVSPIFDKEHKVRDDLLGIIAQTISCGNPKFINIGISIQIHKILSMP